ncbi:hypothetical protein BJX65DRAFT_194857 [Aspergillus insuetus]
MYMKLPLFLTLMLSISYFLLCSFFNCLSKDLPTIFLISYLPIYISIYFLHTYIVLSCDVVWVETLLLVAYLYITQSFQVERMNCIDRVEDL